jgi:hypothetical protein
MSSVSTNERTPTWRILPGSTNLMEQMLSEKRSTVFADFLSATRLQMEKTGLIKVYKEVLDKLDSSLPGMPGLPDGLE